MLLIDRSLAGLAIVTVAGTTNGSFPAPSKRITIWKWKPIWLVYSLFAMIILPLAWGSLVGHGMTARLAHSDLVTALRVGGFGFLWVVGSLLFGASLLARLGMAITNALISGIVVLSGSPGPLLLGGTAAGNWALLVAVSILVSNTWDIVTGEWRGAVCGPKALMWISTALLIIAAAVLAIARTTV